MAKMISNFKRRPMLWLGVFGAILLCAAVVQAALPTISLNSPASFPVDI